MTIVSIITGILSLLIFSHLQPYDIKFDKEVRIGKNEIVVFKDLNNDGKSEKIIFISDNDIGISSIVIKEGEIYHGQWNIKGMFAKNVFYSFNDYDKNGYEEIYALSIKDDSLFLNVIEAFTSKTIVRNKYIKKLYLLNNVPSVYPHPGIFADFNSDNFDEFLFALSTGGNYKDRVIICYYINEDSVVQTSKTSSCARFPYSILKKDSVFFLAGTIREPGNTTKTYPYSDSLAWIMVYDKSLNFLFNPIEVGEYPSSVYVKPFIDNDEVFFLALYNYTGIFDTSKVFIVDRRGEIVTKLSLPYLKGKISFILYNSNEFIAIYDSDGHINTFDNDFQLLRTIRLKKNLYNYDFLREDITGDNVCDNIFICRDDQSFVFINPVSLSVTPIMNINGASPSSVSVYLDGKNRFISFSLPGKIKLFRFSDNWVYQIKYFIPFIIIILVLSIIFVIKAIFDYYLNKRISRQNEIARLQLINVKSRLDSHFTFNMIDCIGNSFRKNDFETADKLFIRYARMLQQSVQLSGEIAIPLEKELDYIENYLVLERIRSGKKFEFVINNQINLNIKVPKYMLFTFVENAVKHGVFPLVDRKGYISLNTIQKNSSFEFLITDNGIGIKQKNRSEGGTGSGLEIVDQLIKLFKNEYNLMIRYNISDNNPGSRVSIIMKYGK